MFNYFSLFKSRSVSWDDLVFRGRNKAYGAYELRQVYPRHLRTAMLWMLGGVSIISVSPYVVQSLHDERASILVDDTIMVLEPAPVIDAKNEPEPMPEPRSMPKPPALETMRFTPPDVVREDQAPNLTQTIHAINELEGAVVGVADQSGDKTEGLPDISSFSEGLGIGDATPVEVKPALEEKEPNPLEPEFNDIEPNAVNLSEIRRQIRYPDILRETGMQGKVYLRLLIDKEGNVVKHYLVRTAHPLFTESCLKEVYKIKFTPAIHKGKPRKTWVSIPFDFKLNTRSN